MLTTSRRLGELLVDRKVLSRDALEASLQKESDTGVGLTKILMTEKLVAERDLVAATAAMLDIRFWDFQTMPMYPAVDRKVPAELAIRLRAVAVTIEDGHLVVAMEDPTDTAAVEALVSATGFPVVPVLGARDELGRVISAMYGTALADLAQPARSAPVAPEMELHVNVLLEAMMAAGASDLHLTTNIPPTIRVHGSMTPMEQFPVMNGSEIRRMIYAILTQRQRERFETELELDAAHTVPHLGRFRLNVFLQRDNVGAVLRAIPFKIKALDDLGLPPSVAELAKLPRGLVLVTGPTGSGKSTTLASIVDLINSTRACHVITVEDPIEFLHDHKKAVVNQREVGEDTDSFANALKHVLRQDPDVILVGEMRDLETISTALTAAETGHLVFGTLHTQDAPQSIDRVIDVFPAGQQQQIRVQLASSLQAVVTQQLVPLPDGKGRCVASEVLIGTSAVRNLIREGKIHQVYSLMQAGGKWGMQTMDQSLAALITNGKIDMETAKKHCANEDDLRRLLPGVR